MTKETPDYSKYTIEELINSLYHIDRAKYEHNYKCLEQEIRKRFDWNDSISLNSEIAWNKFSEIVNKEDEVSIKLKLRKGYLIKRLQLISLIPVITLFILLLLKVKIDQNYYVLFVLSFGLYIFGEYLQSIFTGEIRLKRKLYRKERPILFFISQFICAICGFVLSVLSIIELISI